MASPCMTLSFLSSVVFWTRFRTSLTILESYSKATTVFAFCNSGTVMFPVPGPISRTTSVGLIPDFWMIAVTTAGFFKKCWPMDVFGVMRLVDAVFKLSSRFIRSFEAEYGLAADIVCSDCPLALFAFGMLKQIEQNGGAEKQADFNELKSLLGMLGQCRWLRNYFSVPSRFRFRFRFRSRFKKRMFGFEWNRLRPQHQSKSQVEKQNTNRIVHNSRKIVDRKSLKKLHFGQDGKVDICFGGCCASRNQCLPFCPWFKTGTEKGGFRNKKQENTLLRRGRQPEKKRRKAISRQTSSSSLITRSRFLISLWRRKK